jgi:hypothetical protein
MEKNIDSLVYSLIDDSEWILLNTEGSVSSEIVIPEQIDGKPVTQIADSAFMDCSSLKSITIPGSVTSIGEWAFSDCKSLRSITISDGVTSIGANAFWGCFSLKSVSLPDSLTSIGDFAFNDCISLSSIVIPNSVKNIGGFVFGGCSKLTIIYAEATSKPYGWHIYWAAECPVAWGYKSSGGQVTYEKITTIYDAQNTNNKSYQTSTNNKSYQTSSNSSINNKSNFSIGLFIFLLLLFWPAAIIYYIIKKS